MRRLAKTANIAHAIVKDPPILIWDEDSSTVDNETEAPIQKSLAMIIQNYITIAIAHRHIYRPIRLG